MPSVHFLCLQCEQRLGRDAGEVSRPCDFCGAANTVVAPDADAVIDRCAACGHEQLYFQKDFNRKTGIALVVLGSIFVPWTYGLSLLGVTILDYIVWRIVKDVDHPRLHRLAHREGRHRLLRVSGRAPRIRGQSFAQTV